MASKSVVHSHQAVPFYRNVKMLAILAQVAFLILLVTFFAFLYSNMIAGLRRSNIPLGFDFLRLTAGFAISESAIPYAPTDTYRRALLAGVVNTLRVSVIGIILSTLLGLVIGIGRLSSNWLLRTVAGAYVDIIRNTPLLVQLIFWYIAVILKLPRVRDSVGIPGLIAASNRGLAVAWPRAGDSMGTWQPWLIAAVIAGAAVYIARRQQLRRADRPGAILPWALLVAAIVALAGAFIAWATTGATPLVLDRPQLAGFNFRGGVTLSPEFFALLLGLTIYTASFIAEIVRAGIQSVPKGQREAARALGLSPALTLRLVIFPQALRVIIPPLTNQYLNLTKNSSLGIAVGYFDLFNVSNTIANQSGRSVQVVVILMGCYLILSLATSAIMNAYNRRIRLVER